MINLTTRSAGDVICRLNMKDFLRTGIQKPLFVTKRIIKGKSKPFMNLTDGKTVAAADCLVPGMVR